MARKRQTEKLLGDNEVLLCNTMSFISTDGSVICTLRIRGEPCRPARKLEYRPIERPLSGALADRNLPQLRDILRDAGFECKVRTSDFFDVRPDASFQAVVGNPPYIRYQSFTGELRAKCF